MARDSWARACGDSCGAARNEKNLLA